MTPDLRAWPILLLEDRYMGTYSGGKWIAIANGDQDGRFAMVLRGAHDSDPDCVDFWADHWDLWWLAVGATPNEAMGNLIKKVAVRMKMEDASLEDGPKDFWDEAPTSAAPRPCPPADTAG